MLEVFLVPPSYQKQLFKLHLLTFIEFQNSEKVNA